MTEIPWDSTEPTKQSLARHIDIYIREEVKKIVQSRLNLEHIFPEGTADDAGEHREGSARIGFGLEADKPDPNFDNPGSVYVTVEEIGGVLEPVLMEYDTGTTWERLGIETVEGAQEKANTAEQEANTYTEDFVADYAWPLSRDRFMISGNITRDTLSISPGDFYALQTIRFGLSQNEQLILRNARFHIGAAPDSTELRLAIDHPEGMWASSSYIGNLSDENIVVFDPTSSHSFNLKIGVYNADDTYSQSLVPGAGWWMDLEKVQN